MVRFVVPYSMIILMIQRLISLKLYAYKNPPEYSYFIREEEYSGGFGLDAKTSLTDIDYV